MGRSRLHLIAPAGSCRKLIDQMGLTSASELITCVQDAVGPEFFVTGDKALIEAAEDEACGGRSDDARRAVDIEEALADSSVAAIVALRGGSWFTRILPSIDFSVMDERTRPVAVFGFSELTTLVNIVGAHSNGIGVYDMSPAFLTYGLKRRFRHVSHQDHASSRARRGKRDGSETRDADADAWVRSRLLPEFNAFFRDIASMLQGRGSSRRISAHTLDRDGGALPDHFNATFVGGNLCVLTTLLGSPYRDHISPVGRWVVLEDYNEHPYRLDRFLAQLTLAGFWDTCEGILLGDFHRGSIDQLSIFQSLLKYHIPHDQPIPVLTTRQVGHIWPMSPLPLHREVAISRTDEQRYAVKWPAATLCVA